MYKKWLADPYRKIESQEISRNIEAKENDIEVAVKALKAEGLAEVTENIAGYSAKITSNGIDIVESEIEPEECQRRKDERKVVMDKLAEYYKKNLHEEVSKEVLVQETGLSPESVTTAVMYLAGNLQIDFYSTMGKNFTAKLNRYGFRSLQTA